MNARKATIGALLSLLLFLTLFGCVSPQTEKDNLTKFTTLEQKYFVVSGYSSSLANMNDYISELSLLKAKTNGESGKVIEAELYSAQAFYYLNKTMIDSASINYKQIKCNSTEVKDLISTIKLASDYSAKSVTAVSALSAEQQNSIRPNQLLIAQGNQQSISEIKKFFDDKC
jgi:hypothetical protein